MTVLEQSDSQAGRPTRSMWWTLHLWQIQPVQDLLWTGLLVLGLWLGYVLRGVFLPVLLGLAAAYVVNPVLTHMEHRWHWRRSVVIGVAITALLTIVILSVVIVVPLVVRETQQLAERIPAYLETVSARGQDYLRKDWVDRIRQSTVDLPSTAMQLLEGMLGNVGGAFGVMGTIMGTMAYLLAASALVPLYFCSFAWHFNQMTARMKTWIPPARRAEVLRIADRMDDVVGSFLRGRLLVMVCMMVMFSVGFMLAGVPYWFLLGCLTGLLSFVPYLAVVGCVAAILMTWVESATGDGGASWTAILLWPTVAYSVVQLLEGWLLTPWIQSKSMEMSAVTVLVVLMMGGALAGLYGLLLAIPVAGCLRILFQELVLPGYRRRMQAQRSHRLDTSL